MRDGAMKKKLKDNSGLTFIEMLCVIPILLLLSLMVNTGLNMAMSSLRECTAGSESQLLLSSLSNALADKLRYCVVTDTTGPAAPAGAPATYDLSIGVVDVTADGKVTVDGKKLLFDGAYGTDGTDGANTRYTAEKPEITVNTDDRTAIFMVKLKVYGTPDSIKNIEAETEFQVRCLNPIKKEATPP